MKISTAVISWLVASCVVGAGVMALASSGVKPISVNIQPDPSTGLTTEQFNVKNRLVQDNKPKSVKHLYVFSPYSGQALLYSTVAGKVTSSSKRITSSTTRGYYKCGEKDEYTCFDGFRINLPSGRQGDTKEVLGDDGTYGSSAPYIYWWDVQGRYHQHFLTDGQIISISDQPLVGVPVVLNLSR